MEPRPSPRLLQQLYMIPVRLPAGVRPAQLSRVVAVSGNTGLAARVLSSSGGSDVGSRAVAAGIKVQNHPLRWTKRPGTTPSTMPSTMPGTMPGTTASGPVHSPYRRARTSPSESSSASLWRPGGATRVEQETSQKEAVVQLPMAAPTSSKHPVRLMIKVDMAVVTASGEPSLGGVQREADLPCSSHQPTKGPDELAGAARRRQRASCMAASPSPVPARFLAKRRATARGAIARSAER